MKTLKTLAIASCLVLSDAARQRDNWERDANGEVDRPAQDDKDEGWKPDNGSWMEQKDEDWEAVTMNKDKGRPDHGKKDEDWEAHTMDKKDEDWEAHTMDKKDEDWEAHTMDKKDEDWEAHTMDKKDEDWEAHIMDKKDEDKGRPDHGEKDEDWEAHIMDKKDGRHDGHHDKDEDWEAHIMDGKDGEYPSLGHGYVDHVEDMCHCHVTKEWVDHDHDDDDEEEKEEEFHHDDVSTMAELFDLFRLEEKERRIRGRNLRDGSDCDCEFFEGGLDEEDDHDDHDGHDHDQGHHHDHHPDMHTSLTYQVAGSTPTDASTIVEVMQQWLIEFMSVGSLSSSSPHLSLGDGSAGIDIDAIVEAAGAEDMDLSEVAARLFQVSSKPSPPPSGHAINEREMSDDGVIVDDAIDNNIFSIFPSKEAGNGDDIQILMLKLADALVEAFPELEMRLSQALDHAVSDSSLRMELDIIEGGAKGKGKEGGAGDGHIIPSSSDGGDGDVVETKPDCENEQEAPLYSRAKDHAADFYDRHKDGWEFWAVASFSLVIILAAFIAALRRCCGGKRRNASGSVAAQRQFVVGNVPLAAVSTLPHNVQPATALLDSPLSCNQGIPIVNNNNFSPQVVVHNSAVPQATKEEPPL